MRQILHISDVHFGPKHLPERSQAVLQLARERRPDLVVVSGDLTQRAKPAQFRDARAFVDALPAPALAVPGNHDVPLYRVWERIFSPYGAYRTHFDAVLEPNFADDELLVVGINTAHGWTLTEGRIRLGRLLELAAQLRQPPDSRFRVIVAHHHLIPPPRFGSQSVSSNAYEAIEVLAEAGADLILSGHHHQTFLATSEQFYPSGRQPVIVAHTGTTTSSRGRGSEANRNTCNWLVVEEATFGISCLHWEEGAGEFVEVSRHHYPRRGRGPYRL